MFTLHQTISLQELNIAPIIAVIMKLIHVKFISSSTDNRQERSCNHLFGMGFIAVREPDANAVFKLVHLVERVKWCRA